MFWVFVSQSLQKNLPIVFLSSTRIQVSVPRKAEILSGNVCGGKIGWRAFSFRFRRAFQIISPKS